MHTMRYSPFSLLSICTMLCPLASKADPLFQGIGQYPKFDSLTGEGYPSEVVKMSGDGSLLAGRAILPDELTTNPLFSTLTYIPFVWRQVDSFAELGPRDWLIKGISNNGSVIVGDVAAGFIETWTNKNGVLFFNTFGGGLGDFATGISGDGRTILGNRFGGRFLYPLTGTTAAARTGVETSSTPFGISDDGAISLLMDNANVYLLRTSPRTRTNCAMLTFENSVPRAISGNGAAMIALQLTPDRANEAVRWSAADGLRIVGPRSSDPTDISFDGSVIVGKILDPLPPFVSSAFVWTSRHGNVNLQLFLTARDVVIPQGWQLTEAVAISDDGRTIAGNGINPAGKNEGWYVTLDASVANTP